MLEKKNVQHLLRMRDKNNVSIIKFQQIQKKKLNFIVKHGSACVIYVFINKIIVSLNYLHFY